jgi:hypothetical protein
MKDLNSAATQVVKRIGLCSTVELLHKHKKAKKALDDADFSIRSCKPLSFASQLGLHQP